MGKCISFGGRAWEHGRPARLWCGPAACVLGKNMQTDALQDTVEAPPWIVRHTLGLADVSQKHEDDACVALDFGQRNSGDGYGVLTYLRRASAVLGRRRPEKSLEGER